MKTMRGAAPASLPELIRAQDRLSFLYIERSIVHREDNAITMTDDRGTIHVPAATLGVLLLGPGTSITHQAISLLADSGSTAVWVGEAGARYYAHGRSLAASSRLLDVQAALVTSRTDRLRVARTMYAMRFPGEDVAEMTMQQLRGREGVRVQRCYREHAQRTGIEWARRDYDAEDWDAGDQINQALSAAHTSLYGVVHSVIVALGCSPGLGFVHTGHEKSFVYDIADLYKAEISIPVAFDVASTPDLGDVSGTVRRAMRAKITGLKLMKRCTIDIRQLLLGPQDGPADYDVSMSLWDDRDAAVPSGVVYLDPSIDVATPAIGLD